MDTPTQTDNRDEFVERVWDAEGRQDWQAALACTEEARSAFPDDFYFNLKRLELLSAYLDRGGEALPEIEALTTRCWTDPSALGALLRVLTSSQTKELGWDLSCRIADRLEVLIPGRAIELEVHHNLGVYYRVRGEKNRADDHFAKALGYPSSKSGGRPWLFQVK